MSQLFVGIDVAKDHLDVARADLEERWRFDNNTNGIVKLVELLSSWQPNRIVFEATGKLEASLLDALLEAGLPACRINPARARHFAKGCNILAKTDAIDAKVLALYGQLNEPRLTQKPSANQAELAELVTCRRQLVEARIAQSNQRDSTRSKFAIEQLDRVIKLLESSIKALDEEIARLIDDDDDLSKMDQILQSVVSVGPVLSSTLIALASEIGQASHKSLAALVGVAPINRDSGRWRGQRHIQGGRTHVRGVLYVATISALRWNPVIRAKYLALLARGKPKKVAIIACAHKLLRILNALVRDGVLYTNKNPQPT